MSLKKMNQNCLSNFPPMMNDDYCKILSFRLRVNLRITPD